MGVAGSAREALGGFPMSLLWSGANFAQSARMARRESVARSTHSLASCRLDGHCCLYRGGEKSLVAARRRCAVEELAAVEPQRAGRIISSRPPAVELGSHGWDGDLLAATLFLDAWAGNKTNASGPIAD